jgi:hypothetical protein
MATPFAPEEAARRKATLASVLAKVLPPSWPRPVLACGLMSTLSMTMVRWCSAMDASSGLEDIVSKRKGLAPPLRSLAD